MPRASKQRPSGLRGGLNRDAGSPINGVNGEWRKRVFRNSYTRKGQRYFLNGWSVKIQHHGLRRTFSLHARNITAAATEARSLHDVIQTEGWQAALRKYSGRPCAEAGGIPAIRKFWENRLLVQRYPFPASGGSAKDLTVWIEHGETGYWFPLGTSDSQIAAARAQQIYQSVLRQNWAATCRAHSRELVLGFEWCSNPVLWSYTTIHTLVNTPPDPCPAAGRMCSQRVVIVEQDPGVSQALQWCIRQQPEFACIPCNVGVPFNQLLIRHKPCLVLLNRDLIRSAGVPQAAKGRVARIQPGVHVLTYAVRTHGDQFFVSTPAGARGYLLRRVRPWQLLSPLLHVPEPVDWMANDLLPRVRSFFRDLLMPDGCGDASGWPRLTHREHEVLTLLSRGCVDKEIAEALGITIWTVHGHVKSLFQRLAVRTRTEAVIRYFEHLQPANEAIQLKAVKTRETI